MKRPIHSRLRKLALSVMLSATVLPAAAQLGDDGFYRVKNTVTDRYIYITDNKGKVNVSSTTIDALAIQLWKGDEKAVCDPATVLYFSRKSQGHISSDYDITSQGTGIYQIIGRYVTLMKTGDAYFAYGRDSGVTKYLGDANASDDAEGSMSSEVAAPSSGQPDRRKWYVQPITTTGENYFGALPRVTAGGRHYAPMFASFPFSAYSQGVKIFTVTTCAYGMAVAEEVTGTIPANTPCFIECPSTSPSGNRLNVGGTGSAVSGNLLGGVYFENYMATHLNLTPYDRNTMRMLGTMPDGSLGFVTADLSYLPANQCYLKVPAGSPANIKVVTRAEYEAAISAMPTSVSIDQTASKLYEGSTLQLNARVSPSGASSADLKWSSSDTSVATVSASGLVTAVAKGSATITVTTINGLTASCTVTVAPKYPESVSVSPATLKLYAGESAKLTASVSPSDVGQPALTWSTSDASVATVSSDGTVNALKAGSVTISASSANGKSASCVLTVAPEYPESIYLNTGYVSINAGQETTLAATIVPADVKNTTLTWSSSDSSVATVDANGKVTGVKFGNAVITVSSPGGASARCNVYVTQPLPERLDINLSDAIIEVGDKVTLRVSSTPANALLNLTWNSSDANIVSVSASGSTAEITAVAPGEAVVTVTSSDNGVAATSAIKVLPAGIPATAINLTPRSLNLYEGETGQFTATIEPENTSNKFIIWTSNNESIARVDANGRVTAVGASTVPCIITARCGKVSRTATVRVTRFVPVESIELNPTELAVKVGYQYTVNARVTPSDATNATLAWTSSDESVATVDDNGLVIFRGVGNAVITASATDGSGVSATCNVTGLPVPVESIELSRTSVTADEGTSFTLTAQVNPSNATDRTLTWTSSDASVATVDNGAVTLHYPGNAIITVTANDGSGISAACAVTVLAKVILVESIQLTPAELSLKEGESLTLTATVLPENATDKSLSWQSSNESVATVDNTGKVTVLTAGTAVVTVSALDGSGVTATCTVLGTAGILDLLPDSTATVPVYTIDGILLHKAADAETLRRLTPGLYIIGTRKILLH